MNAYKRVDCLSLRFAFQILDLHFEVQIFLCTSQSWWEFTPASYINYSICAHSQVSIHIQSKTSILLCHVDWTTFHMTGFLLLWLFAMLLRRFQFRFYLMAVYDSSFIHWFLPISLKMVPKLYVVYDCNLRISSDIFLPLDPYDREPFGL